MIPETLNITEFISSKVARLAAIALGAILILIVFSLLVFKDDNMGYDVYTVGSDDLVQTLVEAAELVSVEFTEIRAPGGGFEMGGRGGGGDRGGGRGGRGGGFGGGGFSMNIDVTPITFMIPEGSLVEVGDTLIKFDTTTLYEQLESTEEELLTAQEEHGQLLETLSAEEESDVRSYQDMLFSLENAMLNLELAKFEADNVKKERQLSLEIERIDSMKVMTELEANKVIRDSQRSNSLSNIEETKREIEYIKQKIEDFTVITPTPGLVVYVKSGWPVPQSVREGDTPYPGQQLLEIPNLRKLKAEMHINDIDRDKVWIGQSGRLKVEAFPDSWFPGHIASIELLPQKAISFEYSNMRIFEAEFVLDDVDDNIRPGMSGIVELFVDRTENVPVVPLSAVYERDAGRYVSIVDGGSIKEREVVLGNRNFNSVEVIEGVSEGEKILRFYPYSAGFPLGQYQEWVEQASRIEMLNEHFDEIERLGIQFDYDRVRGSVGGTSSPQEAGSQPMEITDDMIKQMLERMGREVTPENIQEMRKTMEERMRSGGGMRGEGRGRGEFGQGRTQGGDRSSGGRSRTTPVKKDTTGGGQESLFH